MTDLPDVLHTFRDQLLDATERDVNRGASRRRRRGLFRVGAASVAVAVAAVCAVVIVTQVGGHTSIADAAVLLRARAALVPPAGSVLHAAATVTTDKGTSPYELWVLTDGTHAYRVIKDGRELSWDGNHYTEYIAETHTFVLNTSHEPRGSIDIAAALQTLVDNGRAHVVTTTVIAGIPAYQIAVSGQSGGWMTGVANGSYEVARSDYRPLVVTTPGETVRFRAYEYLPPTAQNLRLLDVRSAHPEASARH